MKADSHRLPLKTPHHYPMPWGRMQIRPLFLSAFDSIRAVVLGLLGLSSPAPPDFESTAPAAHRLQVDGEQRQAQRQHPKAENWQEAEAAPDDERDSQGDAQAARRRHPNREAAEADLMGSWAVV